jgi:exodeoxyribonuclease V alpha subunit
LFETFLVEDYGFDLLEDVQLLTPRKDGPLGTNSLNAELQRIVQKKLWGVDVDPPQLDRPPELLLHDRVIQTRNNYEIGVMNGTIGTVTKPLFKGKLTVRFDDRQVEIGPPTSSRNDLRLAYALTFHKCQGSEFPCAVVVIHSDHAWKMHDRNLFYTGVTRAREVAIIVGDPQGIRACAKKVRVDDRKTFLSLLDLPSFEERENE